MKATHRQFQSYRQLCFKNCLMQGFLTQRAFFQGEKANKRLKTRGNKKCRLCYDILLEYLNVSVHVNSSIEALQIKMHVFKKIYI